MKTFLLVLLFVMISEILTYKIIKWIDKRERKKLYQWELKYIQELEEIKKLKKKKGKENVCITDSNNSVDSNDSVSFETGGECNLQATK